MNQIIFTTGDCNKLKNHLFAKLDIETGAYGVYKISRGDNSIKVLVNKILLPEDSDYHKRSSAHVAFSPKFTENAIVECENSSGHLLDIHTHPWSEQVSFSSVDDNEAVKTKIPYFAQYVRNTQVAFIVFGKNEDIIQARFWDMTINRLTPIDRIVVI